jgi:nucleoside-diphosphate-sugar epimerase
MQQNNPIVLLTRATGFIGSALIKRLSNDYPVMGLDRPGPPDPPAQVCCASANGRAFRKRHGIPV